MRLKRRMWIKLTPIAFCLILFSCDNNTPGKKDNTQAAHPAIAKVEQAHNKKAFLAQDAVQFDLLLVFRGKERLKGRFTLATNSTVGKIEYASGDVIYFDGSKVFCSDELAANPSKVRFDAYTWSYFFLFPYKLSDPGAQWTDVRKETLANVAYNRQKLTFDSGTGDSPDDWYIAYSDQKSHRIRYSAYIVTLNATKTEAEKDPHAIEYLDYEKVKSIPIAHSWKFWAWREDKGLTERLGEANISNVQFIENFSRNFKIPDGLNEVNAEGKLVDPAS